LALSRNQEVRPARKRHNTVIIKRLRSATARNVHKEQEVDGLRYRERRDRAKRWKSKELELRAIIGIILAMKIRTKPFDFEKLVSSHGWVFLSPFEWCGESKVLSCPVRLSKKRTIQVYIKARSTRKQSQIDVSYKSSTSLSNTHKNKIEGQIYRMLRLDEDFCDFHMLCREDPILGFVFKAKCGGMLRGATAFEDLIKTVCTTNCDWRNTKKMCESLCKLDSGGFPTAEALLRYCPEELSKAVPLGYRARTVWEASKRTSDGKLDLDWWARNKDYDRIESELKGIWGIGEYTVNHMLVLLGDYSRIPVDSEVLGYLRRTHFKGRTVSAKEAVGPYDRYGKYKFLGFKFGRMARKLNYTDK